MATQDYQAGRRYERTLILDLMKQVSLDNQIGTYCYISDVVEYLADHDLANPASEPIADK